MRFDQETIYFVTGVFMLMSGLVLLAARATGRFGRWATTWSAGGIALGLGNFDFLLKDVVALHLAKSAGGVLEVTGWLLTVQGFRLFAGRSPRWTVIAGLMPLLWLLQILSFDAAGYPLRVAHNDMVIAACDAWMAFEAIRLARRERLHTAWIMAGLCLMAMPIALTRSVMAMVTIAGTDVLRTGALAPSLAALLAGFWALRVSVPLLLVAERSHHKLAAIATHDMLTGALNRRGLQEVERQLAGPVALVLMDLDHFKALNDRYGHGCGDAALTLLAEVVRAQGTDGSHFVRLGGDEFLLVMPGRNATHAARVGQAVRTGFAAAVGRLAVADPVPTLSLGIVEGLVRDHVLDPLLSAADRALYRSKQAGRDRLSVVRLAA